MRCSKIKISNFSIIKNNTSNMIRSKVSVACETGQVGKSYMLISQLGESSIETIKLSEGKENE